MAALEHHVLRRDLSFRTEGPASFCPRRCLPVSSHDKGRPASVFLCKAGTIQSERHHVAWLVALAFLVPYWRCQEVEWAQCRHRSFREKYPMNTWQQKRPNTLKHYRWNTEWRTTSVCLCLCCSGVADAYHSYETFRRRNLSCPHIVQILQR